MIGDYRDTSSNSGYIMRSSPHKDRFSNVFLFKILMLIQLLILVASSLYTRTPFIWIWAISSFVPALIVCILTDKKNYVLPSLLLLFISQHAIFIFAQPSWGYSTGSDPINDLHVATVLSEKSHFVLGQIGYARRLSYSYYPLLHLLAVILNKLSGISLASVAVYFVPLFNALLVCFSLFFLNHELFGLRNRERNLATLLFGMCWYYTLFDATFVRESFAFPFVLLSLWVSIRATKHSNRGYAILLPFLFAAVILSHHISSYMLLVLLGFLALSFQIFYRSKRLGRTLLLMVVMLFAYVSFIATTLFVQQMFLSYNAILSIFHPSTISIMRQYAPWRKYLSISYYVIIIIFAFVGGLRLLPSLKKKKNLEAVALVFSFGVIFLLCTLLRYSTSAHPWSWTYYMSLRGIIWAFIGLSVLVALGITDVLKLGNHTSWKGYFLILLVICILAAGKFSQYPPRMDDPAITPDVTYQSYIAAIWLRNEAVHGFNMLVAPYASDIKAFEGSRNMAPYAYLREYYLDEASYDRFTGYIPFIGGFFDKYKNSFDVNIVYSNCDVEIGYKR